MTTFSTADTTQFPITTTSKVYYYPFTNIPVLVGDLPQQQQQQHNHQQQQHHQQQQQLEQWNTTATSDPLSIYTAQQQQAMGSICTRTVQPIFGYNSLAAAAATQQQQQSNHHLHQQQQAAGIVDATIISTTTAGTPMPSSNNLYLASNITTAPRTAIHQQPFLKQDLMQDIEPWLTTTTATHQQEHDSAPASAHSAPTTTFDDTLQDCIDMLSSGCSRVTTRPEDMYSNYSDSSPNNNNNNKSLVVAPSLSEPLMPFLGMRASGPTNTSTSSSSTSTSNSSPSSSSSTSLPFNSNNNSRPTERKRIKSMSAVFEQQQLQQQQQWNIDIPAPAVDWQLVEEDPEALPRLQKPRYKQDEYNPKWVRFSGHLKEGYCDTCGRWLQLKNSAYWYHKQFYHGISSVSGKRFYEPLEQRISNEGVIEGLCHQCGYFVPICNGKRQKNSLLWYKHAHKCHVYNKPEKFTTATAMTTTTTTTPTVASSHRSFPL